ncbi:MOSC domain-containing protein [Natronomonas sp. EA1]|uniref:MOSC domain-containing protein n=1 Tax=Natronomonas sp. EA1 TaxID=3421655 RepID=UPI003EB71D95
MSGRVEGIWYADADSEPMVSVERIEAIEGGLAGDRYATGKGYYSPFDVCAVTFIEAEIIDDIRDAGIDLTDGRHRRNVVTRGVDVTDLLETRFRVGEAVFEGTRPRPPCVHVEEVAGEDGVAKALAGDRGGICADVVTPGEFGVGDEIEIVEDLSFDAEGLAASIADRSDAEIL